MGKLIIDGMQLSRFGKRKRMRLSKREAELLSAIELRANEPLSKVVRGLKYREHTLRHYLQRITNEQQLFPKPLFNFANLGRSRYTLHFSVPHNANLAKRTLLEELLTLPNLLSLTELSGELEYELQLLAEGPEDVVPFIDQVSEKLNVALCNRCVSAVLNHTYFGRKYLRPDQPPSAPIVLGGLSRNVCQVSQSDRLIIDALLTTPFSSARAFARAFAIAPSTLQYRLRRLQEQGIIAGWIYPFEPAFLGVQRYRCLLSFSRLRQQIKDQLYDFCMNHLQVISLTQTLGAWDFELTAETDGTDQVVALRAELHETFGSALGASRLLTVLNYSESRSRLFAEERQELPEVA